MHDLHRTRIVERELRALGSMRTLPARPEPTYTLRAAARRAVELRHGRARATGHEQTARQMRGPDRDHREPLPELEAAPLGREEWHGEHERPTRHEHEPEDPESAGYV